MLAVESCSGLLVRFVRDSGKLRVRRSGDMQTWFHIGLKGDCSGFGPRCVLVPPESHPCWPWLMLLVAVVLDAVAEPGEEGGDGDPVPFLQ